MASLTHKKSKSPIPLPVEFVLHPSWWHKNTGITFDKDFFFNPIRRVEAERIMEQTLYERWGKYGIGRNRDKNLPVIGAVHLAAGFIISEMLGCRVEYQEDSSPQVLCANGQGVVTDSYQAFESPVFKKLTSMMDSMKEKYGFLVGDINWGGILNIALDVWGQNILLEFYDDFEKTTKRFTEISQVIETFTSLIKKETGSTSISVNRSILNFSPDLFLHSVCSLTMISAENYEKYLLPFDTDWSASNRPFGLHYCGTDPHRFAESFAKLPRLEYLDIGWDGDVTLLRNHLPHTFFNLRLSPIEFVSWEPKTIEKTVRELVGKAGDPNLVGICCINLDDRVEDHQIEALLKSVQDLRRELFPETLQ